MSLITCCPACQTMFKVSGEDLRVSDGWVRCGKCDGVFDASLHLQALPTELEVTSVPEDAGSFDAPSAPTAQPEAPAFPDERGQPEQLVQPIMGATSFPAAERPNLFRSATPEGLVRDIASPDAPVSPTPDPAEPGPGALRREDRSARPSFSDEPVSYSTRPVPARSPWRLVLGLLALTALVLALLAVARHERQALVQRMPAVLPLVDVLCDLSACDVQAPRLLNALVIEGASLEEVAPAEYKVHLQLKNTGAVAAAMPALDVTLTGHKGEALASHMALPAQFAPGLLRLAPGAPMNVTFTFQAALPKMQAADSLNAAMDGTPAPAAESPGAAGANAANAVPAVPTDPALAAPGLPSAGAVSGYRVIAFYP